MTDSVAALGRAEGRRHRAERDALFARFEARWRDEPLVLDKWFALEAHVGARRTRWRACKRLLAHPRFNARNPNRVRSLVGAFALRNFARFHGRDGGGYAFAADQVLALDADQSAARGADRRRVQPLEALRRAAPRPDAGGAAADRRCAGPVAGRHRSGDAHARQLIDAALPRFTGRLVLRRLRGSDLARFQSYRGDPEVGRYQGWMAMDDAGAAAFIEAMARAPIGVRGEWFQIAVADSATDALVGDIGFRLDDDRAGVAEIGFSMAPAAQGRGLGTEAVQGALAMLFDSATVDVVEGITDARNAPSIRLLERIGMRLVRVQEATCKGEQCTEHVYRISRPAWVATAKSTARNPS